MATFMPHLEILPDSQRELWNELRTTPEHFTLYGGTALAVQLGHRTSVDFDFFSNESFVTDELMTSIPYLKGAEPLEISKNSLTCRVDRRGAVKLQFFGGLSLGRVEHRRQPMGAGFWVASMLDIAGTKVKVLPERSEEKDYIDIDALLKHGIGLPQMLAAARAIYGPVYNALLSLKALTYFADLPRLPEDVRSRLIEAAIAVDPTALPVISTLSTSAQAGSNR